MKNFFDAAAAKEVKPLALRDDAPVRRNSPTVQDHVVNDELDMDAERERLLGLIDRIGHGLPSARPPYI